MELLEKARQVVSLLMEKGLRITFAESCTGGAAAAQLVAVDSASHVFDGSFVTYANEIKCRCVGVAPRTIEAHGVVSEEVAQEMARGAAKAMDAQVAVGISGIAGPTGATPGKPVGMVCFGFFINGTEYTATRRFGSIGRNAVRAASVEFVYDTLLKLLN